MSGCRQLEQTFVQHIPDTFVDLFRPVPGKREVAVAEFEPRLFRRVSRKRVVILQILLHKSMDPAPGDMAAEPVNFT